MKIRVFTRTGLVFEDRPRTEYQSIEQLVSWLASEIRHDTVRMRRGPTQIVIPSSSIEYVEVVPEEGDDQKGAGE